MNEIHPIKVGSIWSVELCWITEYSFVTITKRAIQFLPFTVTFRYTQYQLVSRVAIYTLQFTKCTAALCERVQCSAVLCSLVQCSAVVQCPLQCSSTVNSVVQCSIWPPLPPGVCWLALTDTGAGADSIHWLDTLYTMHTAQYTAQCTLHCTLNTKH